MAAWPGWRVGSVFVAVTVEKTRAVTSHVKKEFISGVNITCAVVAGNRWEGRSPQAPTLLTGIPGGRAAPPPLPLHLPCADPEAQALQRLGHVLPAGGHADNHQQLGVASFKERSDQGPEGRKALAGRRPVGAATGGPGAQEPQRLPSRPWD